jgi:hypothetical protein
MNKLVIDPKASKPLGVKINTKKIVGKEEFKCRAEDLYRALTDVQVRQFNDLQVNSYTRVSEIDVSQCLEDFHTLLTSLITIVILKSFHFSSFTKVWFVVCRI